MSAYTWPIFCLSRGNALYTSFDLVLYGVGVCIIEPQTYGDITHAQIAVPHQSIRNFMSLLSQLFDDAEYDGGP
jgi:hypothetical protein